MSRQSNDNQDSHNSAVVATKEANDSAQQELFNTIFAEYPHSVARDVSRQERKDNDYVSLSLVYGEVVFAPFKRVIDQLIRQNLVLTKPGGVFLDIGSGSGKAVFAAALSHDFDACYGIEILEGLHGISQEVVVNWDKKLKKQVSISMQKKRTRISFLHGDALELDWPSTPPADLIFMNSTCFDQRLLRELTKKLNVYCKPGAIVITGTHALPDTQSFDNLGIMAVEQEAWGEATWFIHRKKYY